MKYCYVLLLVIGLFLAGCTSPQAPQVPVSPGANNTTVQPVVNNTPAQPPPNASNGTVPQPPPTQAPPPGGNVAQSQADCAVLTPDCGACTAISGCGWCKTSNSCFFGDANGPQSGQCQASDWTVTATGCSGPAGGSSCSQQTNCASCLSGSGCKYCIAGSKCVDASSTESCSAGTWLNTSYQCNPGEG
jgi:hypothetical protein